MEKISLVDNNLKVSKFIYGTSRIHHIFSKKERQKILSEAIECGFTHFDTSPLYDYGIAEKELGILTKSHPNITITSKFGIYAPGKTQKSDWEIYVRKSGGKLIPALSRVEKNFDTKMARKILTSSLRRLNKECIELFMLHEPPENFINLSETLDSLNHLKSPGLIREFGVSGRWITLKQIYLKAPEILKVVQTRDEEGVPFADLEKFNGITRFFAYGNGKSSPYAELSYLDRIRFALRRNICGAIIVSTNKVNRISQYDKLLGIQSDS